MAEYKLTVFRDSRPIFDIDLGADSVIEIMRSFDAAWKEKKEESGPPPVAKKAGGPKVRKCGGCGEPGHRIEACTKKK